MSILLKMTPQEFVAKFRAMRDYMKARRKSINQDEKRKRRDERRRKRKAKQQQKQPEIKHNPAKDEKAKDVLPTKLITTKIEREITTPVAETNENKKKSRGNPKQALQKILSRKEKISILKQADPETAAKLELKTTISNAITRAHGDSVKDDESKLKRSIKRKEHGKKVSEKGWSQRVNKEKLALRVKQGKRNENVKTRIEKIKAKKLNRRKRR